MLPESCRRGIHLNMHWFFIALVAPALWSASNHLDKFFIGRYFKHRGPGALVLFSSLFAAVVMPTILLFHPHVFDISLQHTAVIICSGILATVSVILYLYALQRDEASFVVPLWQFTPVFAFLLAYVVLGETLSARQLVGAVIIIVSGVVLSLDFHGARIQIKRSTLFLMLAAAFLLAVSGLLFKVVAIEGSYWTTAFWAYAGDLLIGLTLFAAISQYRREFLRVLREGSQRIVALNMFSELITVIAGLSLRYATLLAPLALVWTVNGFQPFFVFLFGVILTRFFPRLGTETLDRKTILQKGAAIIVMFVGTVILSQ